MRIALSLLALFAIAVAAALLAGNNQGTITLFWPPYRVDLSLNLVLAVMLGAFLVLHLALRALSLLFGMPREARRWRIQHRERAMFVAMVDSLAHLVAGRFIRARKSAEMVLLQEGVLHRGGEKPIYGDRLRSMAHLLAAESAHSLQNREDREAHFREALSQSNKRDAQETREGVQLRAARWALDDRDAAATLRWLEELPHGASRRTVAMRLRLKAARLGGQTTTALETARLLAKHRAFSVAAGQSIVRGLVLELIGTTHDAAQLEKVWAALDAAERTNPDVAIIAAKRLLSLHGEVAQSRAWLLPVWDQMLASVAAVVSQADPAARQPLMPELTQDQRVGLIETLEQGFAQTPDAPDAAWLTRIEGAQLRFPGDPTLQYLAGMTCMHLKLWGKAQQLLTQSLPQLRSVKLARSAWLNLALLAEQRGDAPAATQALKKALSSV
jgi:HemY protein